MKMSGLICHYLYENTCSLQKQQPVRAGRGSKESPAPRGHQIGGASLRATQNPRAVAPSRLGLVRGGVSGWGGAGGSPASSVGVSPLQSRTQKGSPARLGDLTPAREGAGGLYGVFSKWVERATRPSRLATRQPEWPDASGFSNAPVSEKRVSPFPPAGGRKQIAWPTPRLIGGIAGKMCCCNSTAILGCVSWPKMPASISTCCSTPFSPPWRIANKTAGAELMMEPVSGPARFEITGSEIQSNAPRQGGQPTHANDRAWLPRLRPDAMFVWPRAGACPPLGGAAIRSTGNRQ